MLTCLGDRPVRYLRSTCTGDHITPEYRTPRGGWGLVPSLNDWECVSNASFEKPILPGGIAEGNFALPTLPPGYDLTVLRAPRDYLLRFTFWPSACFASPDATFCLTRETLNKLVSSR